MRFFADYHPVILLVYYLIVVGITMFTIHPLIILFSFSGSLIFYGLITSWRKLCKELLFIIPFFMTITLTNPLFVHQGETVIVSLFQLQITLEAIFYGAVIALMLIAVIYWSRAYSLLMTSEKITFLFSTTLPQLSLVITMSIRFIPLFIEQMKKVMQTQKTLGLFVRNKKRDAVKGGIRTFQNLVAWSLENAINQADAMKARGYGLAGRTNYTLFRWQVTDSILGIVIFILFTYYIFLQVQQVFYFSFYPIMTPIILTVHEMFRFLMIFFIMILPSLLEIKEQVYWRYLQSKN